METNLSRRVVQSLPHTLYLNMLVNWVILVANCSFDGNVGVSLYTLFPFALHKMNSRPKLLLDEFFGVLEEIVLNVKVSEVDVV